ncbi:Abi family protein [Pantoea rwandensis]|uniref:CAAX protease n=1 Tax=Pantoea rwandensis TaxID=1076550 RepID=A0A1X1D4Q1_9GAMM|nr:Abi family protein [Pantoea rwandensis]ORM71655.1 hypothetical protein HA51_00840 [Pantoea rwandensis]
MPNNFDFTDMVKLISPARLASYHSAFSIENKAELFGLYGWNLELSGALGSLLQLVEVALRNAINDAGKNSITTLPNQHWFELLPYHLIEDVNALPNSAGIKPMVKSPQVRDFENGLAKAKRSAQKLLKKKLGSDTAAAPTLDQIISQTDFSVWEYVMDKSFYDGDASKGFLWPKGYLYAFKKLPLVTGKNKQFQQRDIIRRRIESIRTLRNRIAHNEPVWKGTGFYDKSKTIEGLEEKISEVIELTYWISPSLNVFVRHSALMQRLRMIVSEHEINNATYRNATVNVSDFKSLLDCFDENKTTYRKTLISSGNFTGFIYSKNIDSTDDTFTARFTQPAVNVESCN